MDAAGSPVARRMHQEQLLRLAAALKQLPEDQQTAVELHHLQELPLQAIAEPMGRTKRHPGENPAAPSRSTRDGIKFASTSRHCRTVESGSGAVVWLGNAC